MGVIPGFNAVGLNSGASGAKNWGQELGPRTGAKKWGQEAVLAVIVGPGSISGAKFHFQWGH